MNQQRIELIKQKLNAAFSPTHLEVIDESHQHIGHAGTKDGRGHFAVIVTAENFKNKSRIEAHRMIYEALGTMMQTDIHALRIKVKD